MTDGDRRFSDLDLAGATFRNVNLAGAKMIDVLLIDAEISGEIDGLTVNGIEVAPLIAEEMDRRYPERTQLFASDPDGLVRAWTIIENLWDSTLARARELPEHRLHERFGEEWSVLETLRHLVLVTDSWVARAVLGRSQPYHPCGVPPSFVTNGREFGIDVDADPRLDEVLALRRDRMDLVREVIAAATPSELERRCPPIDEPGFPFDTERRVLDCLWNVIDEEWAHNRYVNRDLDTLNAPGSR